ncbi:MAG: AraC family transcriptional regulator [Clostridia bacterium]|nr:AraC family transcriptional regulator [Clostridia bacterium]
METYTLGINHYPGMKVPLKCNLKEDFSQNLQNGSYRLLIIEEGTGFIRLAHRRELVSAPALVCLNELELPEVEQVSNIKAKSLYFHPSFINSAFTFENTRAGSEQFLLTDIRDRHWLRPFFERNESFHGILPIGYMSLKKIQQLFDTLSFELAEQRDGFWPCRSRSYLLEALFLTERAYMEPQAREEIVVDSISEEISKVILYLHTHYQNKITLEELSKVFHINRTTLNKRFNEEVGLPVMTYLIKLRMNIASAMLRDTMIPIVEIMDRLGFKDPAHFVRMFKKSTGCSPSEYRQQNCWLMR